MACGSQAIHGRSSLLPTGTPLDKAMQVACSVLLAFMPADPPPTGRMTALSTDVRNRTIFVTSSVIFRCILTVQLVYLESSRKGKSSGIESNAKKSELLHLAKKSKKSEIPTSHTLRDGLIEALIALSKALAGTTEGAGDAVFFNL